MSWINETLTKYVMPEYFVNRSDSVLESLPPGLTDREYFLVSLAVVLVINVTIIYYHFKRSKE